MVEGEKEEGVGVEEGVRELVMAQGGISNRSNLEGMRDRSKSWLQIGELRKLIGKQWS